MDFTIESPDELRPLLRTYAERYLRAPDRSRLYRSGARREDDAAMPRSPRLLVAALSAMLLTGCATATPTLLDDDVGRDPVAGHRDGGRRTGADRGTHVGHVAEAAAAARQPG